MADLAPGSILQRMYLKERIAYLKPKSFCEIGSGNGYISELLLKKGMRGIGYDLNESACVNNRQLNKAYIDKGLYSVVNGNALSSSPTEKFDYIISCMVIEHLDPDTVNQYFEFCNRALSPSGTIAVLVPANMKYWGVEDEIAGHFKRYAFADFEEIAKRHNLKVTDISGLTYPVSNWLLRISNYLVKENEGYKQALTMQDQTVLSGNRNIKYKTTFPDYFKIFLNDLTLLPFHLLQKMNRKSESSMVIYCELQR